VGFIEMFAGANIAMLLPQKFRKLGLVFNDTAGRLSSTSFTIANSTSAALICVAFQSLCTLCSAPGFRHAVLQ
jgi:type IV secretory pathway VirB3-like protein